MSVTVEAIFLTGGVLTVSIAAFWLLLFRAPGRSDGPRQPRLRHGRHVAVFGRRGPSRPRCKQCRHNPWNGSPSLLCAACEERYWDALDEFSRLGVKG